MKNDNKNFDSELPVLIPEYPDARYFTDAVPAVKALCELYAKGTSFLYNNFSAIMAGAPIKHRYRAFYPKIVVVSTSYANVDSRIAFGHLAGPGTYETTVTHPDLFYHYLKDQIDLLIGNHGVRIEVGLSDIPIPLHFAFPEGQHIDGAIEENFDQPLRDVFDTPDLSVTDDKIANGEYDDNPNTVQPLAPFTAPRVDYSLHRLAHYTATSPLHFQNYILFTNYQFYMDEFVDFAKNAIGDPDSGYDAFVEGGNLVTLAGDTSPSSGSPAKRLPQMPTYHLTRPGKSGITMINIGVGPSNAKTITDHVAVLRPHTWLMLGHCAGLRNSQSLGDYVLAHGYVREDSVLDEDLPLWIPIPPLAEVQIALEQAVAEVTGLTEYTLKKIMRTGTVATIDNRNWELRNQAGPIKRLSQSRAVALDMESATIAANGFRFRVPYGTLLCVSDKPLHGELKLPGMATEFYTRQVAQHLKIGIVALEKVREMPSERLHSRKLRAFNETAFQ